MDVRSSIPQGRSNMSRLQGLSAVPADTDTIWLLHIHLVGKLSYKITIDQHTLWWFLLDLSNYQNNLAVSCPLVQII